MNSPAALGGGVYVIAVRPKEVYIKIVSGRLSILEPELFVIKFAALNS